jgi:hypothetical protein
LISDFWHILLCGSAVTPESGSHGQVAEPAPTLLGVWPGAGPLMV